MENMKLQALTRLVMMTWLSVAIVGVGALASIARGETETDFSGQVYESGLDAHESVSKASDSEPSTAAESPCSAARVDRELFMECVAVNEQRTRQGLPALRADMKLNAVARSFAADMSRRGYFSHESPEGATMLTRFKAAGVSYGWAGENIARGQQDVSEVMTSWMTSSGHRANILGSHFRRIGLGHVGNVWVQEFSD